MKRHPRWIMAIACIAMASAPAETFAQAKKSGVQQPTTKDGKCAKANGGVYDTRRNGWYTTDLLAYRKCMSGQ